MLHLLTRQHRSARVSLAAATALLAAASLTACGGSDGDHASSSAKASPSSSADKSTPASQDPSNREKSSNPKVKGADTKCRDYVAMSKEDQIKVVQDTSKELDSEDVSEDQAAQVVDSIKGFCQEDDLKDGTMRDFAKK